MIFGHSSRATKKKALTWIDKKIQNILLGFKERWPLGSRAVWFWWQRRRRGWDDSETWSLDYILAVFILPRLVQFREVKGGYPRGLPGKRWDNILDDMIYGIGYYANQWEASGDDTHKWHWSQIDHKRVDRGLRSFGKYFGHLWW